MKQRLPRILRSPKLLSLNRLNLVAKQLRRSDKKMVFTNGCFDILHVGHVCYLEAARKLGSYLVVGINSDRSVKKLKGPNRPLNDEQSRARVLAGLESVDYVVVFDTKRVTPVVRHLKPEIYVKGGDYTIDKLNSEERNEIESYGGKIRILPLWKGYSTTKTISKMKK